MTKIMKRTLILPGESWYAQMQHGIHGLSVGRQLSNGSTPASDSWQHKRGQLQDQERKCVQPMGLMGCTFIQSRQDSTTATKSALCRTKHATVTLCTTVRREHPRPPLDTTSDHFLVVTVFSPLGWAAAGISRSEGAVWERTMVHLNFAEPALFYVRLLFGAGDLIGQGVLRPEMRFHLTQKAVKEMNEAISDPRRCTSEAVILAVSFIALFEVSFGGDLSVARVHRAAQAQMLASRGGLSALALPDIVKHIIGWSDGVVAQSTNMPRVLEDESADLDRWSESQSKTMAKEWVPHMDL